MEIKTISLQKAVLDNSKDVDTFWALQKSVANPLTYRMGNISRKEARHRFQISSILFIKEDETIVGVIEYLFKDFNLGYIQGIAVNPKYQRKGIGKKALQLLLREYFNHTERVELNTHPDNPALSLYLSLGFEIEGAKKPLLTLAFTKI